MNYHFNEKLANKIINPRIFGDELTKNETRDKHLKEKSTFFKKRGIIKLSRKFIDEDPEGILKIFEKILIIKAENSFFTDEVIYYGYSNYFDEIEDIEYPSEYIAEVKMELEDDIPKIKEFKWNKKQ